MKHIVLYCTYLDFGRLSSRCCDTLPWSSDECFDMAWWIFAGNLESLFPTFNGKQLYLAQYCRYKKTNISRGPTASVQGD